MAVALLFEVPGMFQEQYDGAVAAGRMERLFPEGMISHVAGPMDRGWRVWDVWESSTAFDRVDEQTLALSMGRQAPVPIAEWPVHALRSSGRVIAPSNV
jgi:hypothetical protein